MRADLPEKLEGFIRERWGGRFSLANYRHIVSHYLDDAPVRGKRILDIGCGNGLLLSTHAVLFDPRLAVGMDNYEGEGSPITDLGFLHRVRSALSLPGLFLVKGDALRLPFRDGAFDIVFASHFLHHVYIDRKRLRDETNEGCATLMGLLRDLHAVLSDDGVLVVVEVPRYTGLRLAKPFGFFGDTDFETKQEPKDWIGALAKAGFRRFLLKYHTPFPVRRYRAILGSSFGRYLVSGQYYILAFKNDG